MYKPHAFGKYLLLEKISHGGMGEVYKAKSYGSKGFEKICAIKRILPKYSNNTSFITMLADEAKIIVSLSHSNIAHVYEFNQIADSYYLAMEFIHGKDLRSIIERVSTIPPEIASYFVAELSKGLHYLHTARDVSGNKLGIVHRDISPRNVIVSYDGEVKIIDFGIAHARNRAFTIGNDIFVGKYAYMSPEQLLGKELTPQSDIFSAGIVLYELLFKKLPPGRMGNRSALILDESDTSHVDPKLDKNLMNTIPKELKDIIEKATAINPDDRYKNALGLYTDLMRFIMNSNDSVNDFTTANYIKTLFSSDIHGSKEGAQESETIILSPETLSFTEQKKIAVLHINIEPQVESPDEEILGFFQEVMRIVLKHNGMVHRLQKTELIAVFGLPKNKEDDIYRTLHATIEIRNYVQSCKAGFRIALDYGNVIVNFKNDDLNNFTISEGPEKQVKELIAIASPGDILCGSLIESMGMGLFEFSTVERNGQKYPTLLDISKDVLPQDHKEHFVNRTQKLALVEKSLRDVTIETGKIITITGEAGIGKTAFIHEIVRRTQELNTQVFVGSFREHVKTPYAVFKQLIIQIFTGEHSNREISLSQIAELQGFGLTPMELESIKSIMSMRYKSESLDVLPPEKRKILVFLALKKIMLGFANQKTICIFEDLHLADELSIEALDSILANGPIPNVLLIKTYRKEFIYPWKNIDHEEITIKLEPLDIQMLGNYLQTITHSPIEENSLSQIYSKSSGNPLFAGELTKSLLDNKSLERLNNKYVLGKHKDPRVIPDSLYSLLAARVDALSISTKEFMRLASVIGKEFSSNILYELWNKDRESFKRSLTELQSHGMIHQTSNGFEITHALARDVVYQNTPLEIRKSLHKRIAEYLLEKYMSEIEEYTNELAYHYSNSNDPEKAFHYLIKAGDESHTVYLLNEAHRYYKEAIDCFMNNKDMLGDSFLVLIELKIKAGMVSQILGKLDDTLGSLNDALKISEDQQIKDFIPKIFHQISRVFSIKGDYDKAFQYIDKAITISSYANNQYDTLEFLHEQANMYRTIRNNTKALEILEKGLSEVRKLDDKQLLSKYLNNLGIIYGNIDYKKALGFFKESYLLRREMNNKLSLSVLFSNVSALWYKNKKFDKAIKYAKLALRISSEIEDKLGVCLNLNNLGEIYLEKDDYDKALSYFKQGSEHSQTMFFKEGIVSNCLHIGLIYLLKNYAIDEATILINEALQGAKELKHPELIAKACLVKSRILALEDKTKESQIVFKDAQVIIKQNNLSLVVENFSKKIH